MVVESPKSYSKPTHQVKAYWYVAILLNSANNEAHRADTLTSPAWVVWALTQILKDNWVDSGKIKAFDQNIWTREHMTKRIKNHVDLLLEKWQRPCLLFSTLSYNAEEVYHMCKFLRSTYWNDVEIVIWWQFATKVHELVMKEKWGFNPYIRRWSDYVLLWDWELLLPELLKKHKNNEQLLDVLFDSYEKRVHEKKLEPWKLAWSLSDKKYTIAEFALMDYWNFQGLWDLLKEQRKQAWFTQICRQGQWWPWCSWAANNKDWACWHCSLANITVMNQLSNNKNMRWQFEAVKTIQENTWENVDRIFMVDNQFLPFQKKDANIERLKDLITLKKKYEKEYWFSFDYYVYLTELSLEDPDLVPLFAELWIVETYVWFDHFHPKWAEEQNKWTVSRSRSALDRWNKHDDVDKKLPWLKKKLDALKNAGIKLRIWNVMWWSSETEETISAFYKVIDWMTHPDQWYLVYKENWTLDKEKSTIIAIGLFPLEILPWSWFFKKFWNDVYQVGEREHWKTEKINLYEEALEIMESLKNNGYWTREQQLKLQQLYIDIYSPVWYERILQEKEKIVALLRERGVIWYTVDDSPDAQVFDGTYWKK